MEDFVEVDYIVIGAGIMGSSAAYELAKRGYNVILLEKFDFLHRHGSSHGESIPIRASYPEDRYSGMVDESARLWEEAESGIGYRVCTKTPQLDMGPSDNQALKSLIAYCQSNSIPHRILDRQQVAKEFQGTFNLPDGWIGLSTEMGGVIRPTKAVAMFQTLAIYQGAGLKDKMNVVNIMKDGESGRIGVYTACGKVFSCKKCVVTVGAWSQNLVKTVTGLNLPIQPLQTTVYYWQIKEGSEGIFSPESGFPTFESHGDPYIYGTPSSEYLGLIKVAVHGGSPCDPDNRTWDTDISQQTNVLSPWIEEGFAGLVDSSGPVITESRMYSMTPDGDFVIDFLGGEFGQDVVVAGGFSRQGFKLGPVVGRILADMVLTGEAQGVDLTNYRLGRFFDPGGV